MTIDEELSIIRDNIAEYGQTNITQEEYNMIYNKAIDDMVKNLIRNSKTEVIDGNIELVVTDKRIKTIAELMKESESK